MRALTGLVAALALVTAAPVLGATPQADQTELERELVCPTCETTLAESDAPVARRMKAYVRTRIEQGAGEQQIKRELVAQFGDRVLAAPPRRGLGWLAWALPVAGGAVGGVAVGILAWRWSRRRDGSPPEAGGRLEPDVERRLDDALARFDA